MAITPAESLLSACSLLSDWIPPPDNVATTEINMLNRTTCVVVATVLAIGLLASTAEARSNNGTSIGAKNNVAMVRPGPQPGGNLLHIKNKKVMKAINCAVLPKDPYHHRPCGYW
jgi:hypothetical protein